MPATKKLIRERSLKKKSKNDSQEDITSSLFINFAETLFNDEQMQEFLSPKRRPDGRYVTSEANLDKYIDLRIFRETQIKRFLRWLTTTPPLLNKLFTWIFVSQLGMKLAYFDQQENKDPKKIYKEDGQHTISGEVDDGFTIHNLGHATQLIQTSGMNILTDPVFGNLAPIVYPAMTKSLARDVTANELPRIDVILISHNHRDHVDVDSLKKLLKDQPTLLVPVGDDVFLDH